MGLGSPIASGYPTGYGFPVKFRYSIGTGLPIGLEHPASIQDGVISDGLLFIADELRRRFLYPDGIRAILVG